jgi:undecaprenyl-diphosphatase
MKRFSWGSSTGHLILGAWFLGLAREPERWAATFSFSIIIQCGAILAVLLVYRVRFRSLLAGLAGRDPQGARIARRIVLAFLPAGVLGPIAEDAIATHLNGPWPVALALLVGAVPLLVAGWAYGGRPRDAGLGLADMSWRLALAIGIAQCFAMWPGMSRSMTTIVVGVAGGLMPAAAAEFSFLLGLVTLSGATAFSLADSGPEVLASFGVSSIVIGVGVATISAALAVRWFVDFLSVRRLVLFGWYRVLVGLILVAVLAGGGGG